MRQVETVGNLEEAVGYVLKQAASALRTAMEAALRPLELSVPQYACLELLKQRPGSSNADLARGAFVTRQSMNAVLRGLQDRGLVTRPDAAPHGRSLPALLTPAGRHRLIPASTAVRSIEQLMLSDLLPADQHRLRDDLVRCAAALAAHTRTHGAADGAKDSQPRSGDRTPGGKSTAPAPGPSPPRDHERTAVPADPSDEESRAGLAAPD